jgi:hypothetical protein
MSLLAAGESAGGRTSAGGRQHRRTGGIRVMQKVLAGVIESPFATHLRYRPVMEKIP